MDGGSITGRGSKRDFWTRSHAHDTHTHVCARVQGMRCAHAARTEPATTRRKNIFAADPHDPLPDSIKRPHIEANKRNRPPSGLLSGCPNHVGTAAERLHGSDCKISAWAAFWHTHTPRNGQQRKRSARSDDDSDQTSTTTTIEPRRRWRW